MTDAESRGNPRKRILGLVLILVVLPLILLFWRVDRQYRQERLNHALIVAIKARNEGRAMELLEEGASGNAHENGEAPSFQWLLLHFLNRFWHPGASPEVDPSDHPSAWMLLFDDYDDPCPGLGLARALLDHGARVNERNSVGESALHLVCRYNTSRTIEMTRLLIERGADIEAADDDGTTPLIESYSAAVAELLLEHGAHIEAKDKRGNTPFLHAFLDNNLPVMRVLHQHGANVNARDAGGESSHDISIHDADHTWPEVADLLRQYGAK